MFLYLLITAIVTIAILTWGMRKEYKGPPPIVTHQRNPKKRYPRYSNVTNPKKRRR